MGSHMMDLDMEVALAAHTAESSHPRIKQLGNRRKAEGDIPNQLVFKHQRKGYENHYRSPEYEQQLHELEKKLVLKRDYLEINTLRFKAFTDAIASLHADYEERRTRGGRSCSRDLWIREMIRRAREMKEELEHDEAEVKALEYWYRRIFYGLS
ncbi:hypothetical protein N7486_008146 [Penicillium sp. IBT 16267x]|nr:hypothetical protein N7486_008146 [Penicillium sp. IBT 16267x]